MPIRPLPFFDGFQAGYDELSGAQASCVNLIPVADGLCTRPVAVDWADFPADGPSVGLPIVAIQPLSDRIFFVTDNGSERRVFAWLSSGSVVECSTSDVNTRIEGTLRPNITGWRSLVLIAGGGALQKVNSSLVSSRVTAAPAARDVSIISQRAIVAANDDSGQFYWSDPGEPNAEIWDTTVEFRESEARPDPIVAIEETARELWAFGESTTQVFTPDETETFSPASTIDVGLGARSSVVRYDNFMGWVDDRKRVIFGDGRSVSSESIISDRGLARVLYDMPSITDAWAHRETTGLADLLVWTFPSAGRAFCFDVTTRKWTERRGQNGSTWQKPIATAHAYWPDQLTNIIGTDDGRLMKLSIDSAYEDGQPLRWVARSGFVTSSVLSEPEEIRLILRRGGGSSSDTIRMRWRAFPSSAWSNPVTIPIGQSGDSNPVVRIRPAGPPYRSRQWEISGETSARIQLISAEEIYMEGE
jgi:hypothetical protein